METDMDDFQHYLIGRLVDGPNTMRAGELSDYGIVVGIVYISDDDADHLESTLNVAMSRSAWWVELDWRGRVNYQELETALDVWGAVHDVNYEQDVYLTWLYRDQRDQRLEIVK